MSDTPDITEPAANAAPQPEPDDRSAALLAELRREVAHLEVELDRRAEEVAGLHALLRRTVAVPGGQAGASRRNVGVMLTVLLVAPAVIIVLVMLLVLARRDPSPGPARYGQAPSAEVAEWQTQWT